jgi:hypothetical protein
VAWPLAERYFAGWVNSRGGGDVDTNETQGGVVCMSEHLDRVKGYLLDLGLTVVSENEADELVVVDDEDSGIKQLVIDCEPPIVVLEQLIAPVPADPGQLFVRLLQMNNTLVHGAFVLDETAERIFYRDTLQLANLDLNELEGSVRALSLALAEYGDELLSLLKR